MSDRWSTVLRTCAAVAIASAVCFGAGWRYGRNTPPVTVVKTQTDTIIVRDTITAYKPTPVNVYVVDTLWYEVPVYAGRDTVYMEAALPKTRKVYQDSTYRAVVSGFMPSLDTISVFQRTQIVTNTVTVERDAPRLSWGVQAGVGADPHGMAPYIGVGIQYRLGYLRSRK